MKVEEVFLRLRNPTERGRGVAPVCEFNLAKKGLRILTVQCGSESTWVAFVGQDESDVRGQKRGWVSGMMPSDVMVLLINQPPVFQRGIIRTVRRK